MKVRLVRGCTLVLVGQQRVGDAKRRLEHAFEHIWVCRLLTEEQMAAANALPPIAWPALDQP